MAHVNIVRSQLPKGSGPAQIGLLTGEVQVMFAGLVRFMPHVKRQGEGARRDDTQAFQARAGIACDRRSRPGLRVSGCNWLLHSRKTPPAIVSYLSREIVQALKASDHEKVAAAGIEVVASSPEEFTAFMKADVARMREVIRSASFAN